ncbi:hypothetical protein F892_03090 [Acinetobacter vivianii]|uniref:Uncharacterized protein n=1 Tax=Acinetobacter vivianii TaxID=1776742 RepID=N9PZG9_9GAMM|nr:hypothetical protein [Acinetobacter vivianii]ENX20167.1 hypothetical protein F892_03090 [Acinetobacter vivianii]GGI59386.1 hypothetical protein GCM10011446_08810 [Acinetobacter vivianii]
MQTFLLCVVVSIVFYLVGYSSCLSTYYQRAEKKEPFEAKGKIYRMVEIQVKETE